MGQKTNPINNRLLIVNEWQSKWFGGRNIAKLLVEDLKIRDFLKSELKNAGVEKVELIRSRDRLDIKIHTSKPGMVIGRGGQGINRLRDLVTSKFYPGGTPGIRVDIIENRLPELSAVLVAQSIGNQIERRIPYRRAAKQAVERTMAAKGLGIKVIVSGRLNGAEIARTEKFGQGSIPLSRFASRIDYAVYHAQTTYGVVGVKVWINLGDKVETEEE
ncbi:MAG: 30S ribosomal protein S3 [Patescibacteria group bacterium]